EARFRDQGWAKNIVCADRTAMIVGVGSAGKAPGWKPRPAVQSKWSRRANVGDQGTVSHEIAEFVRDVMIATGIDVVGGVTLHRAHRVIRSRRIGRCEVRRRGWVTAGGTWRDERVV